jgi:hypothetical protein
MRFDSHLAVCALGISLFLNMPLGSGEERGPQGVALGIEKPLRISPRPGNGRNSEGDFIALKDGRIMLIYSKFTGTGDHAAADLVARSSPDNGKTWTSEDATVGAVVV